MFHPSFLPAGQVAALHRLGPDYQSALSGVESSGLLDQHPAAAAALALAATAAAGAGGGVEGAAPQGPPPKLLLAFCPQAASAAERSALGSTGQGHRSRNGSRAICDAVLGAPAALLPGTQLCRTQQPQDVLHCLGGIAVLLQLLEQPDAEQGKQHAGSGSCSGVSTAAGVLRLLAAMLWGSPTNQQAMQQVGGFSLVAHLLEHLQGEGQLTSELLAAQQQLLGAVAESEQLTQDALR